MIIVDVNILMYAVDRDSIYHDKVKLWLEDALSGNETIAFPWIVLLAFIRLTTRPGIFSKALPIQTALTLVQAWLDEPFAIVLHPGPRHFSVLRDLLLSLGTGGNLTSDAHLAALSIEHGAELYSLDSDFARFPQVRWRNPLA